MKIGLPDFMRGISRKVKPDVCNNSQPLSGADVQEEVKKCVIRITINEGLYGELSQIARYYDCTNLDLYEDNIEKVFQLGVTITRLIAENKGKYLQVIRDDGTSITIEVNKADQRPKFCLVVDNTKK